MLFFVFLVSTKLGLMLGLTSVNNYILDTTFVDQLCENSYIVFQASSRSPIECVSLCTITHGCNSLIVHKTNEACYGLNSYYACTGQTTPMLGAKFYRQAIVPDDGLCNSDLLSGPQAVADSQMTASSNWNSFLPQNGRLDHSSHWSAGATGTAEYLQVDFLSAKNITGVATQGSCCSHNQWVSSYRFLYSTDCVTFTSMQSVGADKIFTGNSDDTTIVTNTFPTPVIGKCIRLNPKTWNGWVTTRIGVLGCAVTS